ncbi:MAG: hypothetical protein KBD76_16065, partial [Bacteriovorax sp.]|nr:hypothetical protein [Bacteriovorax sp.]
EFFESLMAYAVREEKRDNFKDVASKVRELSIQFKDTSNEELLKAKEIFQQEDLEKLSTYLKGFRERTLKKLQTAVSNQSFLSFDTLEMRPSVFFNPFDTILKLEEEKNVNQVTLSQLTDEKKVTEPKLNEPFKSVQSALGDHKILPIDYVGTYNERSNLGSSSGISYPKIPTIHTDHPDIQSSPFGAVFLGNEVAIPLSLKQYLPQKDQFFFLNIQQHDKNEEPLSLKPQYALFPGAPASSQDTQKATVGWTIIPGVEEKIIPEQGETKDTLWKETVSIHPTGENNDKLILSGNSMRLQGIDTKKSMDCYSFIDADNATLLTYHWMLTPLDFENFNQVLSVSDTLNELIQNLDNKQFLPNILEQLKLYVKYN